MEFSHHLSLDLPGGVERRKNGDDNHGSGGTAISNHSQTLDHHHLQQLQQLNLDHSRHMNSVSVTPSFTPIGITQASGRSELKTPSRSPVRYRECLKNHAASVGGNVVDGCGEFMPSGEKGTLEALTCAACNCHRNFHRKSVDGEMQFRRSMVVHPLQLPPSLPSPTPIRHQRLSSSHNLATINASPMAVAYGGTSGGTDSSSEEFNNNNNTSNHNVYEHSNYVGDIPPPPAPPYGMSKKRFRTRFTTEQKERMLEFAEKVGWRIQKQYEGELEKLCDEVGVKRQVLKVWMHNNKNNSLKKQMEQEQDQPS